MAQAKTLQFAVPDMDCQGCVSSITEAVKRLDSRALISADLATKLVLVDSSVDANEIAHAIEDAGYTVKAV